jgi:hypothetical protein
MNLKNLIGITLTLSIVALVACTSFAQQKPHGQTPEGKPPESSSIFVVGKIEYNQSEGGYFIRGDHPYGKIFRIANQSPELLEPLLKSGDKHVNIEGRLTPGTNILFVEKIRGKAYLGKP